MKIKLNYEKPSVEVVVLKQQQSLLAGSVNATMNGTWEEEEILLP